MRPEKKTISDDIRSWLVDAAYVILTDFRGLKVRQTDDLRKRLAGLQARLHVVPNRQCKRVMAELNWKVADEALSGPTALVSGPGDAVETAKLLRTFAEEERLPRVKLGRFEGRLFTPAEIEIMVKLPARPVLYAMLAGTIAAPMTRLAGGLSRKLASLVYVLKAVQDKKSQAQ